MLVSVVDVLHDVLLLHDTRKKKVYSSGLNQEVGMGDYLLVVSLHFNPGWFLFTTFLFFIFHFIGKRQDNTLKGTVCFYVMKHWCFFHCTHRKVETLFVEDKGELYSWFYELLYCTVLFVQTALDTLLAFVISSRLESFVFFFPVELWQSRCRLRKKDHFQVLCKYLGRFVKYCKIQWDLLPNSFSLDHWFAILE